MRYSNLKPGTDPEVTSESSGSWNEPTAGYNYPQAAKRRAPYALRACEACRRRADTDQVNATQGSRGGSTLSARWNPETIASMLCSLQEQPDSLTSRIQTPGLNPLPPQSLPQQGEFPANALGPACIHFLQRSPQTSIFQKPTSIKSVLCSATNAQSLADNLACYPAAGWDVLSLPPKNENPQQIYLVLLLLPFLYNYPISIAHAMVLRGMGHVVRK
ncbi:hypothetical protein V2G26_018291 [Clonostachys chloroleuca]